jgi:formylglycine-generating enzyme required for sulfatase activity
MAGNVWEWCRTGWVGSYDGYEEKVIDDLEAEVARVLRGGAWINGPGDVRCAGRFNVTPGSRDYSIGFRCVVVGASAR